MSEHKATPKTEEAKKVTSELGSNETATSFEGASYDFGPGVMAFKSLQAAADDSPRSNSITQLQAKADDAANNDSNGILQLQAMADARATTLTEPIQRQENKTGLPDNLKSGMENLSGYSMDDVKVHRNSDKPAQLQAHAYAQGTDIHLGPGQEKHLPHELGHVVQQKQGRVKPTKQMKGKVNINDDAGLEKEADVMGAKALQMKNKNRTVGGDSVVTKNSSVTQLLKGDGSPPDPKSTFDNLQNLVISDDKSYTVLEAHRFKNDDGGKPESDHLFSGSSRDEEVVQAGIKVTLLGDKEVDGFLFVEVLLKHGTKKLWAERDKIIKSDVWKHFGLDIDEYGGAEAAEDVLDISQSALDSTSSLMDGAFLRGVEVRGDDKKGTWGYKSDIDSSQERAVNATGAAASGLAIFSDIINIKNALTDGKIKNTGSYIDIMASATDLVANAANVIDAAAKASQKEGETSGIGGESLLGKGGKDSASTGSNDAAMVAGAINEGMQMVKNAYLGWKAVKSMYDGRELNAKDSAKALNHSAKAAQSGIKIAKEAYSIINGAVPLDIMSSIPAIGIVINFVSLFIEYGEYNEISGEQDAMADSTVKEKEILDKQFSKDDTVNSDESKGVYRSELRGNLGFRTEYTRVRPKLIKDLNASNNAINKEGGDFSGYSEKQHELDESIKQNQDKLEANQNKKTNQEKNLNEKKEEKKEGEGRIPKIKRHIEEDHTTAEALRNEKDMLEDLQKKVSDSEKITQESILKRASEFIFGPDKEYLENKLKLNEKEGLDGKELQKEITKRWKTIEENQDSLKKAMENNVKILDEIRQVESDIGKTEDSIKSLKSNIGGQTKEKDFYRSKFSDFLNHEENLNNSGLDGDSKKMIIDKILGSNKDAISDILHKIHNYDTSSKLTEINQKRKINKGGDITKELISLGVNIMSLTPVAPFAIAGKIALAGASLAHSAGKAGQKMYRNYNPDEADEGSGANINKSDKVKNEFYAKMVNSILNNIGNAKTDEEVTHAKAKLKATGVNMKILNLHAKDRPAEVPKIILEALQKR